MVMANNEQKVIQHQQFGTTAEIRSPKAIKAVDNLTANKFLKADADKNIVPSTLGEADILSEADVNALIDAKIDGLDWQTAVLGIQVDDTLDPGATPATGARYILTDVGNLNANFGTIAGVGNNDIVEFNGDEFIVAYDVSVKGEGAFVNNEANNTSYYYTGSAWSIRSITTYTADEVTLTLDAGEFSVKDGGIDTAQLADGAVEFAKIDVAAKPVTIAFATTDFASSSDDVLSIAKEDHGLGAEIAVLWQEDQGAGVMKKANVSEVISATGDITLTLPLTTKFNGVARIIRAAAAV